MSRTTCVTARRRPPLCCGRRSGRSPPAGRRPNENSRLAAGRPGGRRASPSPPRPGTWDNSLPLRRQGAIATGVVGDPAVAAILAALDVAAERGRAAALDGHITLSWPRLRCPALASRQAAPWR